MNSPYGDCHAIGDTLAMEMGTYSRCFRVGSSMIGYAHKFGDEHELSSEAQIWTKLAIECVRGSGGAKQAKQGKGAGEISDRT
jgi:hypothetical protein